MLVVMNDHWSPILISIISQVQNGLHQQIKNIKKPGQTMGLGEMKKSAMMAPMSKGSSLELRKTKVSGVTTQRSMLSSCYVPMRSGLNLPRVQKAPGWPSTPLMDWLQSACGLTVLPVSWRTTTGQLPSDLRQVKSKWSVSSEKYFFKGLYGKQSSNQTWRTIWWKLRTLDELRSVSRQYAHHRPTDQSGHIKFWFNRADWCQILLPICSQQQGR